MTKRQVLIEEVLIDGKWIETGRRILFPIEEQQFREYDDVEPETWEKKSDDK